MHWLTVNKTNLGWIYHKAADTFHHTARKNDNESQLGRYARIWRSVVQGDIVVRSIMRMFGCCCFYRILQSNVLTFCQFWKFFFLFFCSLSLCVDGERVLAVPFIVLLSFSWCVIHWKYETSVFMLFHATKYKRKYENNPHVTIYQFHVEIVTGRKKTKYKENATHHTR